MVGREKILIVDDDAKMLDAYRRHLKKSFDVDIAKDGELAMTMVGRNGPYAVIISDFRMPGMDGIDFLSRVREASAESVRMMLTGYADLNIVMEAVNEGYIFRFLTKPCKPDDLHGALEAGVRQYQLIQKERELAESRRIQSVLQQAKDRLKEIVEERTRELMASNQRLQQEVEEKRRAEKALRDSREILQIAMDNIPQCIFWKDANSAYLGCNRNFSKLAGVEDPKNIVGKTDDELPWPYAGLLKRYGEFAMETNSPGFEVIEEFDEKAGKTISWDAGSFPFHDEEGTVIGVLGMIEDISDEIASEEALIRQERNESIGKLARAFYNELQEPLMAMDASRDVLMNSRKDNALYAHAKNISDQVAVINQIALKLKKLAGVTRSR
ncbi:response regulator [Desulfococcus sp.]|uniref:ATP-binding response regulator n=1 Tax=Desulfococcus sp. TaxID=2025834 RepID=UPI003593703B